MPSSVDPPTPGSQQLDHAPALEAERLRRARVNVWEWEGGGLGAPCPPPDPRVESLVDRAVEGIGSRSVGVADVGTGLGAVAVAVALRAPARKEQQWTSA